MNASNSRTVGSEGREDRRTVSGCDSDVQIVNVLSARPAARKPANADLLVAAQKHIADYLAGAVADDCGCATVEQPSPALHGLSMDEDEAIRTLHNRFGFRTFHIGYLMQYGNSIGTADMVVRHATWTVTIHGEDLGELYHCVAFSSDTLATAVQMACKSSIPATSIP